MSSNWKHSGVTIRPRGGLGNQLFIYASGRELAERHGVPLFIDPIWFYGPSERQFELTPLLAAKHSTMVTPQASPLKHLVRLFGHRALALEERLLRNSTKQITEATFNFDSKLDPTMAGKTLVGYFQSSKYFETVTESLLAEISSVTKGFAPRDSLRNDLFGQDIPRIAVHVRRGDYLGDLERKYHGILGLDYYKAALGKLKDTVGEFLVVPFSDDLAFATDMLQKIHSPVSRTKLAPEFSAWPELARMASLDGIITANSSLSWWAAWLLAQKGQPCVAPEPWYGPLGPKSTDVIPHSWFSISHQMTV